jgi:hypothetical protein
LSAKASSDLPVNFASLTTRVCKVNALAAVIQKGGTCVIEATQPGSEEYLAAPPVDVKFAITPASQTIKFAPIKGPEFAKTTLTLSASSSSGLKVSFVSTTHKVCTVSGTTAKLLIAGTCTIRASQAGNADYAPASEVSRSFTVLQARRSSRNGDEVR